MSNQQKPSKSNPIVGIVVGVALMAGGAYMAFNHQPAGLYSATESLASQGIPLDLGKTVAAIGVFLILFPVINSFFLVPLWTAIHERNSALEETFSEAESLRAEMTTMKSEYEKRLSDTEASAREQIQAEIRKAQELRTQLENDARVRADDYLKKATEEIDREKSRAITDIRLHVVDLTLGATEKILGDNMDNDRNRRLIQEFVDKIEVPS